MRQFFAGAALTALLTVAISGIVAGKVYVPVATSSSGLAEAAPAQQAPAATPSSDVVLTYPVAADKPVDGPLAIDLSVVLTGYPSHGVSLPATQQTARLTYDGAPLAGAAVTGRLADPLDYVPDWVAATVPYASRPSCELGSPSCGGAFLTNTDAGGRTTSGVHPLSAFHRGTTLIYTAAASYSGRSVLVTKRVLIE